MKAEKSVSVYRECCLVHNCAREKARVKHSEHIIPAELNHFQSEALKSSGQPLPGNLLKFVALRPTLKSTHVHYPLTFDAVVSDAEVPRDIQASARQRAVR